MYGLERNCMVSNLEPNGLGGAWSRQVCIVLKDNISDEMLTLNDKDVQKKPNPKY